MEQNIKPREILVESDWMEDSDIRDTQTFEGEEVEVDPSLLQYEIRTLKEENAQLKLELTEEQRRNRDLRNKNEDLRDTNRHLVRRIRILDVLIPGLTSLLNPRNGKGEDTIGADIGHYLKQFTFFDPRQRQN